MTIATEKIPDVSDIKDIAEEFENETRALSALNGLLSGCLEQDGVDLQELAYLLDPIIERQKELTGQLFSLLYPEKTDSNDC